MKFLAKILAGSAKSKKRPTARKPAAASRDNAAPDTSRASPGSLAMPDLTGLSKADRHKALVHHALSVKRSRHDILDNLDARSQKVLRLMAMAMANRMEDTPPAPTRARQPSHDEIMQSGKDIQAAVKIAKTILGEKH